MLAVTVLGTIQLILKYLEDAAVLIAVITVIIVLSYLIMGFSYVKEHIPETIAGVGLVVVNAAFVYLVWRQVSQANETMKEVKRQTDTMNNQLEIANKNLEMAKESQKKLVEEEKKAMLVPECIRYEAMSGGKIEIRQALSIKNYGKGIARS